MTQKLQLPDEPVPPTQGPEPGREECKIHGIKSKYSDYSLKKYMI